MIKITVEIVPFGIGEPRKIGEAKIWNDTTGTHTVGNYGYKLFGENKKLMKEGNIRGFKRKQKHVWELLYLMLKNKYDKT
jgi:hypothetical protein